MDYLHQLVASTVFIFLRLSAILRFTAFKWFILLSGSRISHEGKALKVSVSFSDEHCISIMSFTDSHDAIKFRFHKITLQTVANPFPV